VGRLLALPTAVGLSFGDKRSSLFSKSISMKNKKSFKTFRVREVSSTSHSMFFFAAASFGQKTFGRQTFCRLALEVSLKASSPSQLMTKSRSQRRLGRMFFDQKTSYHFLHRHKFPADLIRQTKTACTLKPFTAVFYDWPK
jgi:hypothetical protein